MRRERARIAGTKGITEYGWAGFALDPHARSTVISMSRRSMAMCGDCTNTAATEIDPKVSETGRYLSFLRDHNLFVMDASTGQEHPLTADGGGT